MHAIHINQQAKPREIPRAAVLRKARTAVVANLALAGTGPAWSAPTEFEEAAISVERNATDGDTEIVMSAIAGDEGLRRLVLITPDDRRVLLLTSSDPTVMGIREFAFESPEPPGDAILAAYPEGIYRFRGVSVTGQRFRSRDRLSHHLVEPTVITNPVQDAVVGTNALTIRWAAVPQATEYLVEFENESTDPEQVLTVNLPANRTSFRVPSGLLVPGSDYQVGVATVGSNGNIVVVETTFATAEG